MASKQIFDCMREQIKDSSFSYTQFDGLMPEEFDVVALGGALNIVGEAEAKWEAVMAELENELKLADEEKKRCSRENPLQFDTAKGYANGISNAIEIIKGKPIKISEVE